MYFFANVSETSRNTNILRISSGHERGDRKNFFFHLQRVKAREIPCPHQPPTRGDNIVSVAQGSAATPGATKQLLQPDRVLRELYIYIYAN